MPKTYEGNLVGTALKVAVVTAKFNSFITESLQSAAVGTLVNHGVDEADVVVVKVPGAFELPVVAGNLAESGNFDAVIALGCVIRGATTHYDYVCSEAAKGLSKASYETGVPVIFGVVTTETIEQAIERAGTKSGNKGADAAVAAIEMANLMKRLAVENLIQA